MKNAITLRHLTYRITECHSTEWSRLRTQHSPFAEILVPFSYAYSEEFFAYLF